MIPLLVSIGAFVLVALYLFNRTNQARFERAKDLPLADDA